MASLRSFVAQIDSPHWRPSIGASIECDDMNRAFNATHILNPGEFRTAYQQGENILRLIRDRFGLSTNEQAAILASYDLQAGSYIEALADPEFRSVHQLYTQAIADVIRPLEPRSLLEAGVGEATTLWEVSRHLSAIEHLYGFDLVWSRVYCGARYLRKRGNRASLLVGELEAIPFPDNSFDVVFTAHAVEPNNGREEVILGELYRVTRKYLALFEPGYELAGPEARARMESHGYCRGLPALAKRRGWRVVDWRMLNVSIHASNPTAVLVIEKNPIELPSYNTKVGIPFSCPACREVLYESDHWFCRTCGLVYPQIKGIPCLSRMSAIVAGRFGEYCCVDPTL
jgi:SAM-dependent methyltransferase